MNLDQNKDYLDKDFFLNEDGEGVFESESSENTAHVCLTDTVEEIMVVNENRKSSDSQELAELVVGLRDNVPLWKKNVQLKWRFNPMFKNYANSEDVQGHIRGIFTTAIDLWGDASPVKFQESSDKWDFEIIIRPDDCTPYGCTLASAFFPNENQNILTLHPKMFAQNNSEQVETLTHEIGHIFGLRHYFAKESEASWRSEVFGVHYPLTIMNYGHNSTLTEQDRTDLKTLYTKVWGGELKDINGLAVKQFNSYLNTLL